MADYNVIDFFVIAIIGCSTLAGLMRGLLKEAISLGTWIAAAVVATMFASPLAATFSGSATASVQNALGSMNAANVNPAQSVTLMALVASFAALFVGTMIIGSILNGILSGAASLAGLGLLNRLFGAVFGAVRGYLIVIIVMFFAELTPLGAQTAWTQSVFVNSMQPMVTSFGTLVSPAWSSLKAEAQQAVQGVGSLQDLGGQLQQGASGLLQGIQGAMPAPQKAP